MRQLDRERVSPFIPISSVTPSVRPIARGKFLFVGEQKLYVRGVTYGTFEPDADGNEFHRHELIERDFAQMRANGFNAVRLYTPPPRSLLDAAARHGLRVMVGLPLERYVGFLIDRKKAPDLDELVRNWVRPCVGHPAVLSYSVGNEIPAPMVRLLGRRKVERFLERMCRSVRAEDPGALVTYVNYPTTEYLELPFLDFVSFNVYLEKRERLEAYLARLHNIAGERPLMMSEVGLDSLRKGEDVQAEVLDWQIRSTFEAGCAGAFVYSWTDEWYRSGEDVRDWRFGLTDRERKPKPALAAVRTAFAESPFGEPRAWPRISVVVCSYNGVRTLRDCMEGLRRLEYPNHEVIVVDDGSTDATSAIAEEYGMRVIRTENRGLSAARNTGMAAATGEIVAYIDDDAWPDPHWLTYLAATFQSTMHAGVGGPNIAPPGDGPIADCVANAPGGPVHVLLGDAEAEHIPGCNMAFRKISLEAIGGFDPVFRTAGDDVDVCWRLQQRGWTLGFSPAAMVWHHRRNSVRAYWRQQKGYGRAEALLEQKWPEKYNAPGHLTWAGRVYGKGLPALLGKPGRVYHGTWGRAPFQSLYQPAPSVLFALPRMPEWYVILLALAGVSGLGAMWPPLLWALPLFVAALAASVLEAVASANRASFSSPGSERRGRWKRVVLTAALHLAQPAARLWGRFRHGLVPWRWRGMAGVAPPLPRTVSVWSESWREPEQRLADVEQSLRKEGAWVARGGDWDDWDLEVRGGMLGSTRLSMAVEEYGCGKQYVRVRARPRCEAVAMAIALLFALLSAAAVIDGAWMTGALLGSVALGLPVRTLVECGRTAGVIKRALAQ